MESLLIVDVDKKKKSIYYITYSLLLKLSHLTNSKNCNEK